MEVNKVILVTESQCQNLSIIHNINIYSLISIKYNQEEKLRERWQFGHSGSQALLTVCRSLTKSSWAWWVTTTVLQIAINKKNSWILWEFGELVSGRSKFTLFKLLRHIREISRSRPGSSFRFSITWWERENVVESRTTWAMTYRVNMRVCDYDSITHGDIQEEFLHGFGVIACSSRYMQAPATSESICNTRL